MSPVATALWTILALWVATSLNFGGASITGKISSLVWGVILPVVFISIIGWFWFSGSNFASSWNPHHFGFFEGMGKSLNYLWAFLGLESAANSDAVDNPKKTYQLPLWVVQSVL